MKSILQMLAFTACISGLKVDFRKELGISNETMALFKRDLGGIDIKQRYSKLRKLANLATVANLTKEQKKELKMKKTVIETPPSEVNGTDISEINEQSGIANFLYHGDINLSEEQLNELIKSTNETSKIAGSRVKRSPALLNATKWTNGIVYYYFDVNVTSNQAKAASISAAIQFIQARTCIRFEVNKVKRNRILFTDGEGCHSKIGMVGDEQIISIGDKCDVMGIIAHEIFHALGFDHTQSRPDRDQYVTVNRDAIKPEGWREFVQYTVHDSHTYTPYEYGSLMHYRANWSANRYYGCSTRCPPSSSANCQNGGDPNPNDCTKCNCPLGYGGDLCDQMPPPSGGCGAELTATPTWQSHSFSLGEKTKEKRNVFTECHHWIKAPADSNIEVRITEMNNAKCRYGCTYNGIEFKLKDQQMTNPKICCDNFLNRIFTSVLNPLPVIAHNRYKISNFTIEYKSAAVTVPPPTTDCSTTTCPPGTKNSKYCCCCVIV